MKFREAELAGAFVIELEPAIDDRGFFARSFCEEEFREHDLPSHFAQCNVSFNRLAGTTRGMHWQVGEHAEVKLVRCTTGAIFDVIVDMRPDSETFHGVFSVELSAGNRRALLVPTGFAHGFQSLEDGSEVFYQMSERHDPGAARGFRWDDPTLGIAWPQPPVAISDLDRALPLLSEVQ